MPSGRSSLCTRRLCWANRITPRTQTGVFVYLSVDTYGKLPNDKSCYLCYDADAGEWADRYHAVPLLPKPVANVNEVAVDDEAAFEEFRASVLEALLHRLSERREEDKELRNAALSSDTQIP